MGDNLDLTVRVRDMRMDNRDKSIHFFHHMAAQERVSSHHLESEEPTAPITSLQLEDILPNYADYKQLRTNFIVLLARIITSRLEQFKCLSDVVPLHIDHEHSEAMKQKCNVVSATLICVVYMVAYFTYLLYTIHMKPTRLITQQEKELKHWHKYLLET